MEMMKDLIQVLKNRINGNETIVIRITGEEGGGMTSVVGRILNYDYRYGGVAEARGKSYSLPRGMPIFRELNYPKFALETIKIRQNMKNVRS